MYYRHLVFCLFFCLISNLKVISGEPARYGDSIEMLIRHTTDKQAQIKLLLAATKQLNSTDPDKAFLFATRALSQAGNSDYSELKLQAMIEISKIEILKTRFTEGMAMILKARELATRLENKKELGEVYLLIGMVRIFKIGRAHV